MFDGDGRKALSHGLELWRFRDEHAPGLLACVDENRSYLRQWMPWLDINRTIDDVRGFVAASLKGYETGTCFRALLAIDGVIGGVIGLEQIESLHRRAHIGYWLAATHQGQGHMTRAVSALIDYAFGERGLQILELRAAVDNHRSRAVAERLGMRFEGVLRQREWLYDSYVDHAVYSLLSAEWPAAA